MWFSTKSFEANFQIIFAPYTEDSLAMKISGIFFCLYNAITIISAEGFQSGHAFSQLSTIINCKNQKKNERNDMKRYFSMFDRISFLSSTLIQSSSVNNNAENAENGQNGNFAKTEILDLKLSVETNLNSNENEINNEKNEKDNSKELKENKRDLDFKSRKKYFIYVDPLDDFGAATVARDKCAELGTAFHVFLFFIFSLKFNQIFQFCFFNNFRIFFESPQ